MAEYLIDGDNLAGWLAQHGYLSHRHDDDGLMRLLSRWQRMMLARGRDQWITLVLDPAPHRDHSRHRDQIWVTVAPDGGTADGCLLQMIEDDVAAGRPLFDATAVTGDRDLAEQLKALGIRVRPTAQFARVLVRGTPPIAEKPAPGAPGFEDIEREFLVRAARRQIASRRRASTQEVMACVERLDASDANARAEAAERLGRLPDRRSVLALIQLLKQDESPRVRAQAARSLGRLGYKMLARAPLLQRLEDPDPSVRAATASALGDLGDSWAIPALQHLAATDAVKSVRQAAWRALRKIGEAQEPDAYFG